MYVRDVDEMIRLAIYCKVGGFKEDLDTSMPCDMVISSMECGIVELWLWCGSVVDFMASLEELLNRAFTPLAIGTLKPQLIPIESFPLDPGSIEGAGLSYATLSGSICGEFIDRVRMNRVARLINVVKPEKMHIDVRRRTICVKTSKPVSVSIFYDNHIRVIKPMTIPPKLEMK